MDALKFFQSSNVRIISVLLAVAAIAAAYHPVCSAYITKAMETEHFRGLFYSLVGIGAYICFLAPKAPIPPKKQSKALLKRRYRTYPPGYPNGWYMLADSKDVAKGDLLNVEALGQNFAVYRGEDGKIGVLDAYCPHLGANMAAGGRVVGNEVECPFHRWKFGRDGKCSNIPYTECIPDVARTKAWPCTEWYGMILVYFDAEGREPPYFPDVIEELEGDSFTYRGAKEIEVEMHLIEFAENSADTQHFDCLHGQMKIPFTDINLPGITINHVPSFETNDHVVIFKDSASLNFCGRKIPRTGADAKITLSGPGGTVYFTFYTELGKVVLFHMHTPVEPLRQRIRFRYYADKSMPRLLAHYIVGNWISQFQADREVWENKVYYSKPLLVKHDGPIARLRRWYAQFYSDSSKEICQGKLDW